jgi:uncharacterized membrane protein
VLLRLRNRLVVGLLVAFPLVVTVFLARFVFRVLDRWFQPISEHFFQIRIHGAGMLLAMLGLVLLGTLATNVLGSRILDAFERFVARLPLFSPIYQGARQITEAVQIRGSRDFQKVVLVAFPHPGIRSIGFVTRELNRPTAFGEEPTFMVFVPTTPNPTSGFLVAVPQSQCTVLKIDVEEGIKLVISGGLLTPPVLMAPGYLTNLASDDSDEDQDEAQREAEDEDRAGPGRPTTPLQ